MNTSYEPGRLQALINKAKSLSPVMVAVVDAGEEHVLQGAFEAAEAGIIVPILIGQKKIIDAIFSKLGQSSRNYTIIESNSEDDAACLSKMAQRRQITNAIVDGPLAFDNAISRQAAQIKQIDSEVSGDADIMLAPDLAAGNILAKGY